MSESRPKPDAECFNSILNLTYKNKLNQDQELDCGMTIDKLEPKSCYVLQLTEITQQDLSHTVIGQDPTDKQSGYEAEKDNNLTHNTNICFVLPLIHNSATKYPWLLHKKRQTNKSFILRKVFHRTTTQ